MCQLVAELQAGRIIVAFVVPATCDGRCAVDVAITPPGAVGAGIRPPYWFVPERASVSSGARGDRVHRVDVRRCADGVVLLDPQDERIEPDRIVSLSERGELLVDRRASHGAVTAQRSENVAKPPGRL